MDVTALTLRGGLPETVTAVLTAREAALVAGVLGRTVLPNEPEVSDVYHALTGCVFNPYWEDGLDDALRSLDVALPARLVPAPAEVPR